MADRDLKFTIKATDQASKVFKDAEKAVKDLGAAEDDTRTKAQQLADEMKAAADKIDAELAEARVASDALGLALGDELVADIKAAGGSVDALVIKLKDAGLTYDEIRADADVLGDAIRRTGDIGKQAGMDIDAGAVQAEGGIDRVRSEADQSRSVLANMAGNTAQDLGAIGGAAGSAGVMIGQLAEYAVDGNIKLGELVKFAAPMALITAAGIGIAGAMERVAKAKAWRREEVDGYKEALKGVTSEVEAIVAKLTDDGGVNVQLFDFLDTKDILPGLTQLGLTVEDFAALVAGGKPKIDEWAGAMEAAGLDVEQYGFVVYAATQQAGFFEEAQEAAKIQSKFFGEQAKITEQQILDSVDAQIKDIEAKGESIRAAQRARDEQNRLNDAYQRGIDKLDIYRGKLDEIAGRLNDDEAYLNLQQNIDDTIATVMDLQIQMDEGAISGEEGTRKQALAMIDLKEQLIAYGEQIGLTPTEIETLLTLTDNGAIEAMELQLGILARNRTMNLDIVARGGTGYTVRVTPDGDVTQKRARGGPVAAGQTYLVGEEGPELLTMGSSGGHVTPNSKLGSALGGQTVLNITVNGADPNQVVNAIKNYVRRNGPIQGIT